MNPNTALLYLLLSIGFPACLVTSIHLATEERELTAVGKLIALPGILCLKLADKLPSIYKEEADT